MRSYTRRAARAVGRLLSHIKRRLGAWRRARERRRRFKAWLAQHPGSTYAHFYIQDTYRSLQAGGPHPTLGVNNVDKGTARRRAQYILAGLQGAGCSPRHVVVDYGCGSLWVGEALMGLRRVCADVRFLGSYERHDGRAPEIRTGTSDREFLDAAAWLARLRHGG